jgi:hypothetical protein
MENKCMAEQIADRVLDLEEHLSAWKSLATQKLRQPTEELESSVETLLGRIRVQSKAREYHAQFVKDIHASKDDIVLKTLFEGILQRSTVGNFDTDS